MFRPSLPRSRSISVCAACFIFLSLFLLWDGLVNEGAISDPVFDHVVSTWQAQTYRGPHRVYDVYDKSTQYQFPQLSDFPNLITHLAGNETDLKTGPKWKIHNEMEFQGLADCLESGGRQCRRNQHKVVMLTSQWSRGGITENWKGGEGVWSLSMYETLRSLGYTIILGEGNYGHTRYLYDLFPSLVVLILQDWNTKCIYDPNDECVKTNTNLLGIPIWKLFEMNYFPGWPPYKTFHPSWMAIAEVPLDFPISSGGETYTGFSLEEECKTHPYIPAQERSKKAYVLAKSSVYFDPHSTAWPSHFWEDVQQELNVEIVAGFGHTNSNNEIPLPGLQNIGLQTPEAYMDNVASSKLLIGVGRPQSSPSPWVALCVGVPFLNPVYRGDVNDPSSCLTWTTQHSSLQCMKPPFVYHVQHRNYTGFRDAIKEALDGGIERFIPEHMTQKAMTERMLKWTTTDWKAKGEVALAERKGNPGPDDLDWVL